MIDNVPRSFDKSIEAASFSASAETSNSIMGSSEGNEPVRTVLRSSYSSHYRRMLPALPGALTFRCNNIAYRPVLDAIELLKRYAVMSGKPRYYAIDDTVPLDGVVPKSWHAASAQLMPKRSFDGSLVVDREHTETSMLSLHLLQSALVHINTLLLQAVLEVPEFHDSISPNEKRGLTPLFWTHINPYGRFQLDMTTRLNLNQESVL